MKNITFSLYAFHLQQCLDDPPDLDNPEADRLWESLTKLGEFLLFTELKNLKSQLVSYSGDTEGNYQYEPQRENQLKNEWLTHHGGAVELTAIGTKSGLKLTGNLQPFRLNDTYCVDITLSPQGTDVEIEVAQLSDFQPKALIEQVTADLGKVIILNGEDSYQNQPESEDAEKWVNALCAGMSVNPLFLGELTLFNCPCFLFESENLTIIICLAKPQQLDLEQATNNYGWLRDLFWTSKKIAATYPEAKESYQRARELYSALEKKVQEFYATFQEKPEEKLNKLDSLVNEIPKDLLDYNCCLRDLKTHYTTIQINSDNFKVCLKRLLEAGNQLEPWSNLAHRQYPQYLQQIETYIDYLEPGKDLFSDLINTIRATAEIEQAKIDRDLQDHIQAIGVGIAAGAIVASTSGLITQPWSLPSRDRPWLPPHPFIIALFASVLCSWGAWWIAKKMIKRGRSG